MPRAIHWTRILAREKKDVISVRAAAIRATEGVTSPGDYLRFFNRALQELASSLSETETDHYKKLAEDETQTLKAVPTPTAIFAYVLSCPSLACS